MLDGSGWSFPQASQASLIGKDGDAPQDQQSTIERTLGPILSVHPERWWARGYIEKLSPQPQLFVTRGLMNLNPASMRPVT